MNAQAEVRVSSRPILLRWAAGFGLVAAAYFLVFIVSRDGTWLDHGQAVLRNVLSLALAAAVCRALIIRHLLRLAGRSLWVAHAAVAGFFSLGWLWLLNIAAAILSAGSATSFTVAPYLNGQGAIWQLLQGLFAYAAIAALVVLEHRPPGGGLLAIDAAALAAGNRFLLRDGEDIVTIQAASIVSISGADDYAELVTTEGTHLVATTLAEFETMLPGSSFVRVHRSAIACLDHVARAEPVGGGRMILRMAVGPDLPVSRAGAKLLREQALSREPVGRKAGARSPILARSTCSTVEEGMTQRSGAQHETPYRRHRLARFHDRLRRAHRL